MLVSSGVSGGHLNPAVSVALASLGKLSWIKVALMITVHSWLFLCVPGSSLPDCPVSWSLHCLLHCLPSLLGCSCLVWAWPWGLPLYSRNSCYLLHLPLTPPLLHRGDCWPILRNPPSPCLYLFQSWHPYQGKNYIWCVHLASQDKDITFIQAPLVTALSVLGLGVSLGYNCGYAVNPARDLAPRIFTGKAENQSRASFFSWLQ